MPRSRFSHATIAQRNATMPRIVVGGRNVDGLICKMLAKRMSSFRVPTDTVMFSRVTSVTNITPARMKMRIDVR